MSYDNQGISIIDPVTGSSEQLLSGGQLITLGRGIVVYFGIFFFTHGLPYLFFPKLLVFFSFSQPHITLPFSFSQT